MFSYYVFYASTEKLARVHVGHCRHCNHGKGPHGRRATRSRRSAWSGAFATSRSDGIADIPDRQRLSVLRGFGTFDRPDSVDGIAIF
jgi:hypothetical protein